eukprot:TRINITY_DN6856_c0_g1_i2.p1 TRINITY_DN6856_c0_g1~~TRINITY_DN6856_c0_g1_i2.p1  ORF type:complete len:390 (+),score=43.43 TRINITY_DN6856_c0_g1_i2:63-1232(+)
MGERTTSPPPTVHEHSPDAEFEAGVNALNVFQVQTSRGVKRKLGGETSLEPRQEIDRSEQATEQAEVWKTKSKHKGGLVDHFELPKKVKKEPERKIGPSPLFLDFELAESTLINATNSSSEYSFVPPKDQFQGYTRKLPNQTQSQITHQPIPHQLPPSHQQPYQHHFHSHFRHAHPHSHQPHQLHQQPPQHPQGPSSHSYYPSQQTQSLSPRPHHHSPPPRRNSPSPSPSTSSPPQPIQALPLHHHYTPPQQIQSHPQLHLNAPLPVHSHRIPMDYSSLAQPPNKIHPVSPRFSLHSDTAPQAPQLTPTPSSPRTPPPTPTPTLTLPILPILSTPTSTPTPTSTSISPDQRNKTQPDHELVTLPSISSLLSGTRNPTTEESSRLGGPQF